MAKKKKLMSRPAPTRRAVTKVKPISKPKPIAKKPARKPAAAASKPVGVSLHIGLNLVDPDAYSGWDGPLGACEFDAHDMADLAKARGFAPSILLTPKATRKSTLAAIRDASAKLRAGDFFLLTYSGHGGQVDDVSGEEEDKLDETWCLFDGQLIDDELFLELGKFAKGVRVLVLSDSCHSGTVVRAMPPRAGTGGPRPRLMPPNIARRVYQEHKAFYDGLQKDVLKAAKSGTSDPDAALAQVTVSGRLTKVSGKVKAGVILISGCQDNQTSMDGDQNGAFTGELLRAWNSGAFKGNYTQFHKTIQGSLPSSQSPNLFTLGPAATFAAEAPFTL